MKTDPISDLFVNPAALLHDLLAVSLTGIDLMRSLYNPGSSELVDFAVEYLNPVAQRITGLPERPNVTARARFPDIFTNGVFDFYRRVFETGEPGRYDFSYQADGFDNYFHVAARRSAELLVVSFTDTADHERSAVEEALRQSQTAERAAHADAQRQRLLTLFDEAPVLIATLTGPDYVVELANEAFQAALGNCPLLGRPYRDAAPELVEQGFFNLFDAVYRTGETYHGRETLVYVDTPDVSRSAPLYYDFIYQAIRDAASTVTGILVFHDVTSR